MIAACHHDIGIWSDHTVDYLPPSIREATQYLSIHQLSHWEEEITLEWIDNRFQESLPVGDADGTATGSEGYKPSPLLAICILCG